MDWEFEVAKGEELSNLISTGFSPPSNMQELLDVLDKKSHGGSIDEGVPLNGRSESFNNSFDPGYDALNYDSSYDPDYPIGGGAGDPPPPDPLPPNTFDPDNPIGPIFDYSELFGGDFFTSWRTVLAEYWGNQPSGMHSNYDSLDQFMNGEWYFDIDPELLGYSPYDQGYGADNVNYSQYTPIANYGIRGANGLVPIFSEWFETELVPSQGGAGMEVDTLIITRHFTFYGLEGSHSYQVASLDDPFAFLGGRVNEVLSVFDLANAWDKFMTGVQGEQNTQAIGTPSISMANGMLMAPVFLDGVRIGDVMVNDNGMRLYDLNGNLLPSPYVLPQEWNTLQGVRFNEQLAHQERTMGVPFAQSIVTFAGLATGTLAGLVWWQALGFSYATSVLNGANATSAAAHARLLEAAFELREYELMHGRP